MILLMIVIDTITLNPEVLHGPLCNSENKGDEISTCNIQRSTPKSGSTITVARCVNLLASESIPCSSSVTCYM